MKPAFTDTLARIESSRQGVRYNRFRPARKPEEYVGQPGPHNGLALEHYVIEAIGQSRVTRQAHPYIVIGEWIRQEDGAHFLDIAVVPIWHARDYVAEPPPQ